MSKFPDYAGFLAFKTLTSLFPLLPRWFCLQVGKGAGFLAFHLDRKHRSIALSNLAIAFGKERSRNELLVLAKKSFIHFGGILADILKISRFPHARIVELVATEGRPFMENALAKKRGVLVFTAHFGNWEFGSAAVSQIGPFQVIARALDNPLLEKELFKLRTKLGAGIIYKFGAGKPILQALRRNEIVAILIDQNVLRSQAVFVDFFGKPAATTPGLAAFHLKTGAPIVPVFCSPTQEGTYCLKIMEPFEIPPTGRFEEDVLKITQICTKIIEHEIRKHPELWLWVHRRWNTRPVDEMTT